MELIKISIFDKTISMPLYSIIILFTISAFIINAQDDGYYQEEITKKELKKQEKAKEKELLKQSVQLMLERKHFVLEANYISNKYGNRFMVNSTLNFIKVDSTEIIIQLASNNGMGYNGLGGITLEGGINKYELKETKHGYSLRISSMTHLGSMDVFLSVSNSGTADAQVSDIAGGSVRYSGKIIPIELSRIYKGSRF